MMRFARVIFVAFAATLSITELPSRGESGTTLPPSGSLGATAQPEADSLLQAIAQATLLGATDGISVWPGWDLPTEFIVCRPGGASILVLSEPPPARFGSSDVIDLEYGHIGYLYEEPLPGLRTCRLRLDFPVAGRELVTFPIIDSIYSVGGEVLATAIALFHESFHQFQATSFSDGMIGPVWAAVRLPSRDILQSAEFERLASLERQLLLRALDSADQEGLRAILRRYLAVRWTRLQLVPSSRRGAEAHEERKEATAHVAGYQVGVALFGSELPTVVELVRRDLASTPSFSGPSPQPGGNFREWHIYACGAAVALSLERLGVDWRTEVQSGDTLVDLLTATLQWEEQMAESLFMDVVDDLGRSVGLEGPTADN